MKIKFPAWSDLNSEEVGIGAIFGLIFAFKVGALCLPLAYVTAYLWAAGGAEKEDNGNKLYRRLGCSVIPTLVVVCVTRDLWQVSAALPAFGCLSMGYGIPTTQPVDTGSFLGRFFYDLVKRTWEDPKTFYLSELERWATFWTRLVTDGLLVFSFYGVPPIFKWVVQTGISMVHLLYHYL